MASSLLVVSSVPSQSLAFLGGSHTGAFLGGSHTGAILGGSHKCLQIQARQLMAMNRIRDCYHQEPVCLLNTICDGYNSLKSAVGCRKFHSKTTHLHNIIVEISQQSVKANESNGCGPLHVKDTSNVRDETIDYLLDESRSRMLNLSSAALVDEFSHLKYWETEYTSRAFEQNSTEDLQYLDESGKYWEAMSTAILPYHTLNAQITDDSHENFINQYHEGEVYHNNQFRSHSSNVDAADESMSQESSHNDSSGEQPDHLSHVNSRGEASMVDVSGKSVSHRTAVARGTVILDALCYRLIAENRMKKGDVLVTARLAGIMAAKRTAELIPLCHPIPIGHIDVTARLEKTSTAAIEYSVELTASVSTVGRTGVEMEALTAVTVAALTVYDMCKAVTHDMTIERVQLVRKVGGKRDFNRNALN